MQNTIKYKYTLIAKIAFMLYYLILTYDFAYEMSGKSQGKIILIKKGKGKSQGSA